MSTTVGAAEGYIENEWMCRPGPAVRTSRSLARDGIDCALCRPSSDRLQACVVGDAEAQGLGMV